MYLADTKTEPAPQDHFKKTHIRTIRKSDVSEKIN